MGVSLWYIALPQTLLFFFWNNLGLPPCSPISFLMKLSTTLCSSLKRGSVGSTNFTNDLCSSCFEFVKSLQPCKICWKEKTLKNLQCRHFSSEWSLFSSKTHALPTLYCFSLPAVSCRILLLSHRYNNTTNFFIFFILQLFQILKLSEFAAAGSSDQSVSCFIGSYSSAVPTSQNIHATSFVYTNSNFKIQNLS